MKIIMFSILVLLQVSCTSVDINYEDAKYLAKLEEVKNAMSYSPKIIYREIISGEAVFVLR